MDRLDLITADWVRDGEHNSRLNALRDKASADKDYLALVDLAFVDPIRKDRFGDYDLHTPAAVVTINGRLAREYAVKHHTIVTVGWRATAWDAFCEYDALNNADALELAE